MARRISEAYISVFRAFTELLVNIEGGYKYEAEIPLSSWQDELGRLRLWGANIGAHQTNQGSLDFRLRDSSHISNEILEILRKLARAIQEGEEIIKEQAEDTSLTNLSIDSDEEETDDGESATELQQLFQHIEALIGCLYKMSMLIRKPATHDRLVGSNFEDLNGYEEFDIRHVQNKFPQCHPDIAERLGRAITRRRKYFKYRARHSAKLAQGIDSIGKAESEYQPTILSATNVTDFAGPHSSFGYTESESGNTATSISLSILGGGDAISIPPPPEASAEGRPFECPYCYLIITIDRKKSWARHVFRDLQPYTCTFRNCPTARKLYHHRRDWFNHEVTAHEAEWYNDRAEQISDLQAGRFAAPERSLVDSPLLKSTCPLCQQLVDSIGVLKNHLARHLEELALFAMPRYEERGEDNEETGPEEQLERVDLDPMGIGSWVHEADGVAQPPSKLSWRNFLEEETESSTQPYTCSFPDCKSTFSRAVDLFRHENTTHSPTRTDCPKPGCVRKGKDGFTHQVHLEQHLRRAHMGKGVFQHGQLEDSYRLKYPEGGV